MTSIDYSQVADDAAHRAIGPVQPEITDLLGIARRGWFTIVACTIFGLICASAILSIIPPIYKANSRIAFERTLPRFMQTNKVTNEPMIDDSDTWGQIYVISSESILLPVVRSLSLASDPEFVGAKGSETLGSRVRGLLRNVANYLGFPEAPPRDRSIEHHNEEKIAFDRLVRDLTVSREDVPSVITVAFSSKDPVQASTIVNAIVDTYMQAGITNKAKSTKVAGNIVQERVEELKRQAADAERALVEYKMANNLVGAAKTTLSGEQLAALQTHLTSARVAMAEAKAGMQRVGDDSDASTFTPPDNDLIARLRAQLLDLSSRANDIESRVGKDHLAAVKFRSRMEELREAIANEQRRIAGSFGKDYELARARYEELSATISRVMGEEGANSGVQARVRELESAAVSLRNLYNRMLQQFSEMNKVEVEAQPSITPDARILTRAAPPLQTEASKKRLLILAGGSVMGLLLGGAIVLVKDFPFGVFRTAQQVTHATGLDCAILPEIVSSVEQASLKTGEYVLDVPYSRFAETLRSIWAMINIAQKQSGAKVICVISSTAGEGKTTVATNLAAHFARHSTARVLLIDADFHRQSLTKRVAPGARVGLKEALEEPRALTKFVTRKEVLNLDTLPCPIPDRIPNAAELLGRVEMEQLLDVARQAYDLVIIEAPPMAAVVDYKMIAPHCSGFIFVVEWGKTSQRMVLECLSEASVLRDRVLCVVLNKVDPSALRSIERYKGDRFHDYYSDQKST